MENAIFCYQHIMYLVCCSGRPQGEEGEKGETDPSEGADSTQWDSATVDTEDVLITSPQRPVITTSDLDTLKSTQTTAPVALDRGVMR